MFTPGLARSADEPEYQIIPLTAEVMKAANDKGWTTCGEYFVALEGPSMKAVLFSFEGFSLSYPFTGFLFVDVEMIKPSVSSTTKGLTVADSDVGYILKMNIKDYKIALPCLGKGEKA
ncbi:MAG: hypothetical protein NUV60_01675 [Patescibacteria group bacterium]|nr:hypothetical protein [Patescibacteria group bacterium]